MMSKSMVSVIIATYNSEKVLENTLIALRNQTYPSELIEILVVDGMSKDRTRQVASRFNCRIIDNEKVEQGNAKILGMKNAKGRFILFVDSDEVLISNDAVIKAVKALENRNECNYAICSGYKKPKGYPRLSGYISDCGDPFSFFMYNCPKDYRFYEKFLRNRYQILDENDDYFYFKAEINKRFVLIEGGCGGSMMDMKYFDQEFPSCRENVASLYHSFYQMYNAGKSEVAFIKDDPLEHYSSDKLIGYVRKLKWRICNNIHFTDKGEQVFSGREQYGKQHRIKKYLFIPYAFSIILPLFHILPYAISRKNIAYLLHPFLSIYVCLQIIIQYINKFMNVSPAFVAYGSKEKISSNEYKMTGRKTP